MQANLVTQVIPEDHLYKIPAYTESFVNYLESLGDELKKRRMSFKDVSRNRNYSKIHIEKMNRLGNIFVNMGLAETHNYPWYYVEGQTAKEFMAYLAATLGNLDDLQFIPVTDELRHLEDFIYSGSRDISPENRISSLRLQILEDLFPAPINPLHASEIEDFKNKHGNLLNEFRRKVESEIISITDISDIDLRERKLELFKQEAEDSIDEIKRRLNESGYNRLTLGKIASIISAVPGVSPFVKLTKAVYDAFRKSDQININRSFLYAAYAQKEILD